jgi:hypothetical protein
MDKKPTLNLVKTGLPHWLLPPRVNPEHPLTDADVEYLFDEMTKGITLASAIRDHGGLPDYGKVLRLLMKDPVLRKRYEEIKEVRGEVYREKYIQALDGYDDEGMPEDVQRSRLKADGYRWLMATDNRKWYGDQKQITVNGQIDIGTAMAKADERVLNAGDSGDVIEHEN